MKSFSTAMHRIDITNINPKIKIEFNKERKRRNIPPSELFEEMWIRYQVYMQPLQQKSNSKKLLELNLHLKKELQNAEENDDAYKIEFYKKALKELELETK